MHKLAYACIWVLIFTIPWENSLLLPGVGTITKLLVFVTAPVGLLAVLAQGRLRPPAAFHILAALFTLWVGLSTAWSINPKETFARFVALAALAMIPWLAWELVVTPTRWRNLVQSYVFGAYVSTFYMLLNYSAGIYSKGRGGTLSLVDSGRYSVEGFNPNSLGFLLVLAIPMAWHLGLTHKNVLLRWVNRAYIPVGTLAVLLTGSRSGLVVLAVALLIVPVTLGRVSAGMKVAVFAVILASVIVVATYVPESTWARLSTTTEEIASGDLNERRIIWQAGWELFPRHPIGGVGAGGFPEAVLPFLGYKIVAHNTLLSVLLELGIVGLILFCLLLLSIYFHARSAAPEERRFVLILLLTFFMGLMPRNWEIEKPTWAILTILITSASATRTVPRAMRWVPAPTRVQPRPEPVGRESARRRQGYLR